MTAPHQLDGAVENSDMEEDSADTPLTPFVLFLLLFAAPNSPNNAGSRNPPPLRSPLTIHQFQIVSNTTTNAEGLGNDAMGDQWDRADAGDMLVDVGGFGIQVELISLRAHPFLAWMIS